MIRSLRPYLLIFAALVAIPIVVDATIQTQRAQITVTITINVTPAPLAFRTRSHSAGQDENPGIDAVATLTSIDPSRSRYHAENLSLVSGSLVAQATNQKAVRVEAEVSPNPNGTLLTSDQTGVIINQTAGTTESYTCLYHVTVTTTVTNWSLDHGLYSNFIDPTSSESFAGSNVANNSYLSTPHPAYTPFAVYSNGQAWALLQENATDKTYCVSLKVTIPASAVQGSYSSQATYTLLY